MLEMPEHLRSPAYDNPEHIEALRRAYERFPAIGGRDSR
ncbi:hypothetical protein EJ065_6157 [Corallococcus coralloides]|uniref:Uncharacterized protein n=1 Tax=Corallococcus coralloides TaxID=184914 RepID=A0A410S0T8_CORCK|nr:DUF5953 family protein [Corallococcus coralloides]QAT87686.1 hypothetical protein EJ065_6157 [Corallococcus coralloides]